MARSLWIRFATFLVWLLAAGCIVYWALKFVSGPAAPLSAAVAAPTSGAGGVDALALAKGLGGGQAPISANPTTAAAPIALQASRFVLTGVVVQKSNRQGVALIAVDGKPPRPYRVGTPLADGVVLHSVSPGKAILSASVDAPPSLSLELPQLTSAVVGTAVAARPNLPSPVFTAPIAASIATTPTNVSANASALPSAALGNRPARSLANRQQEAQKAPAETQPTQ